MDFNPDRADRILKATGHLSGSWFTRKSGRIMEALPSAEEMKTLWRLAGRRTSSEGGEPLNDKFQELRPRTQKVMLEMIFRELELGPPANTPSRDDIVLLLASPHQRVRQLGLRLMGTGLLP